MADNLAVLLTKPPYGTEEAFAGTRLALEGLVSGLVPRSAVFLIGDGTLNAVEAQRPEAIGMPSNLAALKDFMDLQGEVYCVEEDLRSRVGNMKILEGIRLVPWSEAREALRQYQLVTTF